MNDLLPFGHSRKIFKKTTFSLCLLTLGYHFGLTFSLPQNFLASEKEWNKTPCSLRLVLFVPWKISKHVWDLIFLNNNFLHNVFLVCWFPSFHKIQASLLSTPLRHAFPEMSLKSLHKLTACVLLDLNPIVHCMLLVY